MCVLWLLTTAIFPTFQAISLVVFTTYFKQFKLQLSNWWHKGMGCAIILPFLKRTKF
jgi:hypothetical protein